MHLAGGEISNEDLAKGMLTFLSDEANHTFVKDMVDDMTDDTKAEAGLSDFPEEIDDVKEWLEEMDPDEDENGNSILKNIVGYLEENGYMIDEV